MIAFHYLSLLHKPFISKSAFGVVFLPELCSGETSNLWQKEFGKLESISNDTDQSGTSDGFRNEKSAKMAKNSI